VRVGGARRCWALRTRCVGGRRLCSDRRTAAHRSRRFDRPSAASSAVRRLLGSEIVAGFDSALCECVHSWPPARADFGPRTPRCPCRDQSAPRSPESWRSDGAWSRRSASRCDIPLPPSVSRWVNRQPQRLAGQTVRRSSDPASTTRDRVARFAHCETVGATSRMPARPRMRDWPIRLAPGQVPRATALRLLQ